MYVELPHFRNVTCLNGQAGKCIRNNLLFQIPNGNITNSLKAWLMKN